MNAIRVSFLHWLAALRRPRQAPAQTASERHLLHKRLEHARLARMLKRMHVSRDVYLQRVHPEAMQQQLEACAACPHAFLCDQALRPDARCDDANLSFCPNLEAIRALRPAA